MTDYVSWGELSNAITIFNEFLKSAVAASGPIIDYHVIFSMGTVCRVDSNMTEFVEYTGEYIDNFPAHRLPDGYDDIIENNIKVWDDQKKIDGPIGQAIRRAYKALIDDGYPFPGAGSDRVPLPMQALDGRILWNVVWPDRNPTLSNLIIDDDVARGVFCAGELRRYDFMFPKVAAIVAPDLTLHLL